MLSLLRSSSITGYISSLRLAGPSSNLPSYLSLGVRRASWGLVGDGSVLEVATPLPLGLVALLLKCRGV